MIEPFEYTHKWGETPLLPRWENRREKRAAFLCLEVRVNKLIGVEEVAGLTSIPESTIRRMVTKGRIPCVRLGKHVRFDPEDISAWIDRNKVAAQADEAVERG